MTDLPEVKAEQSVAQRLRANFAKAQEKKTQDLMVPGYDELHIVFRGVDDFTELRDALAPADDKSSRHLGETEQYMQAVIRMLVLAAVDSYAVVDGEKVPIGEKLGLPLYNYLFPEDTGDARPQTDGEAVTLIFGGDTVALMMFGAQMSLVNKASAMSTEISGN